MRRGAACLAMAALLLAACGGDTPESKYSKLRAAFSLSPVNTVAPLNEALGSFGQFCTIRADATYYHFHTLTNDQRVPRTALAAYKTFICVGGFIVGRSAQTELGTADYPLLCYDLACPNCYATDGVARAMELTEGGHAQCGRCHRTYDLNNFGLVTGGAKGRKLERYKISYNGTAIMVSN